MTFEERLRARLASLYGIVGRNSSSDFYLQTKQEFHDNVHKNATHLLFSQTFIVVGGKVEITGKKNVSPDV